MSRTPVLFESADGLRFYFGRHHEAASALTAGCYEKGVRAIGRDDHGREG